VGKKDGVLPPCSSCKNKIKLLFILKGLSHEILMPIFFISINSPDLGDGLLKGVNFVRCACAEQPAFYALSRALQIGTNALFWFEISLSMSQ